MKHLLFIILDQFNQAVQCKLKCNKVFYKQ
jgi:hypothetical protein